MTEAILFVHLYAEITDCYDVVAAWFTTGPDKKIKEKSF